MKARIVARVIMPDSLVVGMHVGRFGVSALIHKAAIGRRRCGARRFLNPGRCGTVRRNVSSAHSLHATAASLLGENGIDNDNTATTAMIFTRTSINSLASRELF